MKKMGLLTLDDIVVKQQAFRRRSLRRAAISHTEGEFCSPPARVCDLKLRTSEPGDHLKRYRLSSSASLRKVDAEICGTSTLRYSATSCSMWAFTYGLIERISLSKPSLRLCRAPG